MSKSRKKKKKPNVESYNAKPRSYSEFCTGEEGKESIRLFLNVKLRILEKKSNVEMITNDFLNAKSRVIANFVLKE